MPVWKCCIIRNLPECRWQSVAIRRIGAARAVLIGTLGPVLTIFFSWWLLQEPVSAAQLAGAGLVLAGVLLVSRSKRKPA